MSLFQGGLMSSNRRRSSIFCDEFNAPDGTNIRGRGAWFDGYTGTGASATIQSAKGRWTTGTTGGYSGSSRISCRATNAVLPNNCGFHGVYSQSAECFPEIYVRTSDTIFDTNTGYSFRLPVDGGDENIKIWRFISYSGTQLASQAYAVTSGSSYEVRCEVADTTLRMKIWVPGEAEPSDWMISASDSTHSSGSGGFTVVGGNIASHYIEWDFVEGYTL